MARTERRAADRSIAVTAVVVVHLLLAWLLLHAGKVASPDKPTSTPLQITWIEARVPAPRGASPDTEPPIVGARVARRTESRTLPSETSQPSNSTASDAVVAAAESTDRPLSATFIDQAQALARGSAEPIPAIDPFANRTVALPAADQGRFRMRAPVTPAVIVESIGRLFGGGPSSPCTHLPDDIAELATRGDSAALQDAMAQRAAHCR